MKKLLLATTNKGKIGQIKAILGDLPINLVSPSDINLDLKVLENGKTFEENALIKAEAYSKATGMWALADDMGMEIDILGGEPGVKSKRWPGYEASDTELIRLTLEKLKGVPFKKRKAKFTSAMVVCSPEGKHWKVEGVSNGYISEEPSKIRIEGLPFASLFYVPVCKKNFSELTEEEKKKEGQRMKALKKVKKILIKHLC
jgi:XTP/dITP diphosphohydrolase